jgi:hypothetical protein
MKTKGRVKKSRSQVAASFATHRRSNAVVVPGKAGIHHCTPWDASLPRDWIRAFAGMTVRLHFSTFCVTKTTEQTGNVYENKGVGQKVAESRFQMSRGPEPKASPKPNRSQERVC